MHLQGIIKQANTVNTLVLLHFYVGGAFLCLPDRHFFLEGERGRLLLMKGGSLFELQEAKSQPSIEVVARAGEIMEKSRGKEESLVTGKEHGADAKCSSGNGICGCLEEMTS